MEVVSITPAGKTEGFPMPMMTFEDMMVEYYAYDFDGNVAICLVNITVPDDTPPTLSCPQSVVIELQVQQDEYDIDFNRQFRSQVTASDPSGEPVVTFIPQVVSINAIQYCVAHLTVSLYLYSSGSNAQGESRALEGRRISSKSP